MVEYAAVIHTPLIGLNLCAPLAQTDSMAKTPTGENDTISLARDAKEG
jgi:hypothetical protein